MNEPIWIKEADVVELMSLPEAIEALEQGLLLEDHGDALNMIKTHVAWDHNNLHAIGAAYPGAGMLGTKTWAHTGGGACPLLILFNAENGQLMAIIEAFALGQMRTGGISGVATKWMAREDTDVLALIGTGKQALAQMAAVHAVRPLKQVRVFSPSEDSRRKFIDKACGAFNVQFVDANSVAEALEGAQVITTVTRATRAFLHGSDIAYGAHINAVGAITDEREELAPDVFTRCSRAVVDDIEAARRLSSEYRQAFDEGNKWSNVLRLSSVVAAGLGRQGDADVTIFKAMGMGVSDLALGIEIYKKAKTRRMGVPIPQPQRNAPRLTA